MSAVEARYQETRRSRVQRRVRAFSGVTSLLMVLLFFAFDPMIFAHHPRTRWLHAAHAAALAALWLLLHRPWPLRALERLTVAVWSLVILCSNLPARWVEPEVVPQMVAGNALSMIVAFALSRLSWQACLVLNALTEASLLAVLWWRFPGGLPAYLWPMAPLVPLAVGAVLLVARNERLERAEFESEAVRVRLALRAQSDAFLMELHDGVQGTLSRAAVLLDASAREGPQTPRVAAAGSAVREALEESGAMLAVLEAAPEPWALLVADARHLLASACEGAQLQLRFDASDGDGTLPPAVAHALRRIAREAINNVVRHAGARAVACELARDAAVVRLRVRDDGRGLAGAPDGGRGLGIIHRRAAQVGGTCTIGDHPDGGVLVDVAIPMPR
jgi:two-component system sensor histidine kinase UhpB